jgi:hypothetical protein
MNRRPLLTLALTLAVAAWTAAATAAAEVWRVSETGAATIPGTWTWSPERGAYVARWDNGAIADIRVESRDPKQIVLVRTEAVNSVSAGLTARYVGQLRGGVMSGTVTWMCRGRTTTGTWQARLQLAAGPPLTHGAAANPLSPREVDELFARMAAQPDIAFRYVLDGCYARAHLMIKRMQALGVAADKVWAFPPSPGEALQVFTALPPGGRVEWQYHVAPVVTVRYPGRTADMVIDPSLFNLPVSVADWGAAQRTTAGHNPYLTRVAPNQPPPLPGGRRAVGSYLPSGDPPNPDLAARDVMARYKAREPRP